MYSTTEIAVMLLIYGGGLFALLIVTFVVGMLIQGIVYWTTGFSIYNFLIKKLITDELKK